MTTQSVRNPSCKKCGRIPSVAGNEPLYVVPIGSNHKFLCGGCIKVFIHNEHPSWAKQVDWSNLFTHTDIDRLIRVHIKAAGNNCWAKQWERLLK